MAEKTLSVKLSLNDRQFMSGLRKASSSMKRFGKSMQKTGKNLSRNLTLPILAFGAASVKAFDKQQKALAQVESGLRSTGNAAGFTSEQLQKMAADLQGKTIFGDEVILKDATAQLLTFTNISGEQFARTQEAALDLATRLDGDLKSASIQLGKALNDPVANLSALSRSGIQFSEEQKATIKSLAETNRLADAQTLILDELNKQYGGSAEAAAQAGIGGIQQLQNSLGDLGEEFGKIISDNIGPFVEKVKSLVGFLRGLTDEQKKTIVQVAGFAAALGPAIFLLGKITTAVGGLLKIIRVLGVVMAANPIGLIATAIAGLVAGIVFLATSSSETAVKIRNFFRKMANGVIEAINQMIKAINKIPGLDIDLIDTLDLEEFKKEVKDTTDGVDNITKSINAIPKKTTITIERSAAPGRIEPKKPGQISTDSSLPTELDGVEDIKPDGLESFSEAFFDFSEEFKSTLQNTFSEISNLMGGVSNLFSQIHNKRMIELDNERAKEIDNINNSLRSEEQKEAAINSINDKFDKKKAEADKKQAKRAKAMAILEATVATAAAVVKALPNIPLSIATGVIGAAQIATIASTQIPAFAEGGMVTGATLGLVGEGPGTSMSNPEVIAPLDKLKSMIGEGQGSVEVFGRISGSDILISSDRARKNRDRTRGY
tara:strand:- start:6785 stop:8767 length:1983 start_codon:yes stop_codon:yes gene_type:complete